MQRFALSQNGSILLRIDYLSLGASVSIVELLVWKADSWEEFSVLKVMITAVS